MEAPVPRTSPKRSRALRTLSESAINATTPNKIRVKPTVKTPKPAGNLNVVLGPVEIHSIPQKSNEPTLIQKESSKENISTDTLNIYTILFPPGSMGLDLEPLISSLSPERYIGCRVKDFYFGIDHTGIEEEYVRSTVSQGDIISSIDGCEVLFSQFHDILEKLRGLKLKSRKISFKKLCPESKCHDLVGCYCNDNIYLIYIGGSAPTIQIINSTFSPKKVHQNLVALSASSVESRATTLDSAVILARTPTKRVDVSMLSSESFSVELGTAANDNVRSSATTNIISSISYPKSPTVAPMFSPRNVRKMSRAQTYSTHYNMVSDSEDSRSISATVEKMLSPRKLKQQNDFSLDESRTTECGEHLSDAMPIIQRCAIPASHSNDPDNSDGNSVNAISVGSLHSDVNHGSIVEVSYTQATPANTTVGLKFGYKLASVGMALGHSVATVASVVGESAEKILENSVPLYSTIQMQDIMSKKHSLLRELSHTCMLLGENNIEG